MKDERNWLLREALPVLQNFALSMGTQLQLVDLCWGVSEEMIVHPDIAPIHLEQIRLCQQYSCGPNFVVSNAQNPLHTFPRRRGSCQPVTDLLGTRQHVRNKLATSRRN